MQVNLDALSLFAVHERARFHIPLSAVLREGIIGKGGKMSTEWAVFCERVCLVSFSSPPPPPPLGLFSPLFGFPCSRVYARALTCTYSSYLFTATLPRAMRNVTRKTDGSVRVFCVLPSLDPHVCDPRARTPSLLVPRKTRRQPPRRWFFLGAEEASEAYPREKALVERARQKLIDIADACRQTPRD